MLRDSLRINFIAHTDNHIFDLIKPTVLICENVIICSSSLSKAMTVD